MLVGLPRAGKSTRVQELRRQLRAPVVNADSIRLSLHGQRWQADAEDFVHASARLFVKSLFLAGHGCVILDETNHTRTARDRYLDQRWNRCFVLVDTPLAECVRRAHATGQPDLAEVLPLKAAQLLWPTAEEGPLFSESIAHEIQTDRR